MPPMTSTITSIDYYPKSSFSLTSHFDVEKYITDYQPNDFGTRSGKSNTRSQFMHNHLELSLRQHEKQNQHKHLMIGLLLPIKHGEEYPKNKRNQFWGMLKHCHPVIWMSHRFLKGEVLPHSTFITWAIQMWNNMTLNSLLNITSLQNLDTNLLFGPPDLEQNPQKVKSKDPLRELSVYLHHPLSSHMVNPSLLFQK